MTTTKKEAADAKRAKTKAAGGGRGEQDAAMADPVRLANVLVDVAERAQPILQEFLEKYEHDIDDQSFDPLNMREAYTQFMQHLLSNPQKLAQMQVKFWSDWMQLWQESAQRFISGDTQSVDLFEPEKGDRRFRAPIWQESPLFDFIKQSYILSSKWMQEIVNQTEGLDEESRQKLDFYTKQFVNAVSPTNFLFTNPEVLQETLDTGGENLIRGLKNLVEDIERGGGQLAISTTDYDAFKLGENIATTPGKVIYQNDLMQLIQYEPKTDKVYKTPLLIVPPWINKYYILDLREENSYIKWLVEQGHTVFTISWVNPDRDLAKKRFEDYMEEGVIEALDQVKKVTGEDSANLIGYCLGGTLLAVTLAWLAAHKQEDRVAAATFLTTLVDFKHAGELKMFMDESQLAMIDKSMAERGFLSGEALRKTFSLLRSNDMIWSFVVNNYLMGKEPFPFDLLYWNDDATNMPAAMHSFYMRKCYHDNLLPVPGGVVMNGTPIDLQKVKTPAYFLSTKEDHIAPWKATYATTQLFSGPCHFTLAASGHVAGVVNHPDKNKYCYWTADKYPPHPDDWFNSARSHDGSWWPHWQKWIKKYAGTKVPARKIGGGKLKPIEDAPGSYVKMKVE